MFIMYIFMFPFQWFDLWSFEELLLLFALTTFQVLGEQALDAAYPNNNITADEYVRR